MNNLNFESVITGLSTFSNKFAVGTKDGIYYVINSNDFKIENQFYLPSHSGIPSAPVWSLDGDFIWCFSDNSLYFFKPISGSVCEKIEVDEKIVKIFKHVDGISIVAVLESNKICVVKPMLGQKVDYFGPFGERIISIVNYNRKMALVIDDIEKQTILFLSNVDYEVSKTLDICKRDAIIAFSVASNFGILVFWADGYWEKFDENGTVKSGSCVSALDIDLNESHLCVAHEDGIHIYDMKFDAELQKIDCKASGIALFQNVIISYFEQELKRNSWIGLKTTTTRDLIGTSKPVECKEVKIELEFDPNLAQPTTNDVIQSEPHYSFRSINSIVEGVMEGKFIPAHIIEQAIEELKKPEYDDIRNFALFQIQKTIPFEEVLKSIQDKQMQNALMMMKKMDDLTPDQIVTLIRLSLQNLDENEMILTQFIVKPNDQKVLRDAIHKLNADEVDQIFFFLAKLLASRRKWKNLDASLSTIDSITQLSSILLSAHLSNLTLQNKTAGLKALQKELIKETVRIEAASDCWAVFETLTEKKNSFPPSFMYLVETIDIPE